MSNTTEVSLSKTFEGIYRPLSLPWHRQLLNFLRSPLLLCLLIATIVRVWLIVHTNGVIAGDEAMVGIQAEHILHGEHPIYYYGQPYMGSLQMYFIAGILFFTGPAVWAIRIEPLLISLLLVTLTWFFSDALGEGAHLSQQLKRLFMVIATLVAAFAPLYDTVEELRTTGGYIEDFTLMLWLLFCAYRLTQRWQDGASARELALRWAGIGFLIGFGFWIDPMIVYAVVTIALWIGGYFLFLLIKPEHKTVSYFMTLLKEALLFVVAIPALLIGFAPGIYWGAHHQWANIHYLFQKEGAVPNGRMQTIMQVQSVYTSCLAPRALGGALPTQPNVTVANPHILTFGLVISISSIGVCVAMVLLSVIFKYPLLKRVRQLTLLPLLFMTCASIIFCTASISNYAIYSGCSTWDLVGRYVVPLVITLPFLIATVIALPSIIIYSRNKTARYTTSGMQEPGLRTGLMKSTRLRVLEAIQVGLLIVLGVYFLSQGIAYLQADARTTFQGTGCISANPTDQSQIIKYMQQTKMRYAWASGWLGDPITFKTDGSLLVTEIHGRIQANVDAVLHSDRPGIFFLTVQNDAHPAILKALDARNIAYHIERFYSMRGVDLLLITPLKQTVSPLNPVYHSLFQVVFRGCVTQ